MAKSRQVNFYALTSEVNKFLSTQNQLEIVGLPVFNNKIKTTSSLLEDNFKWSLQYRLTRSDYMSKLMLKHISKQDYFLIDSLRSPVVDLSLCFFDTENNFIRRGRLYFHTGYYIDNEWVEKDKEFLDWANRLLKNLTSSISFERDEFNDLISKDVRTLTIENDLVLKSN